MSHPSPQSEDPSFEDAMQRLDEIVAGMESSQLPLEDMLTIYEEGVRLLRLCRQRIESARRRVDLISTDLEGGRAMLTPFEEGAAPEAETPETAEKARPSPGRRRKLPDAGPDGGEIRLF